MHMHTMVDPEITLIEYIQPLKRQISEASDQLFPPGMKFKITSNENHLDPPDSVYKVDILSPSIHNKLLHLHAHIISASNTSTTFRLFKYSPNKRWEMITDHGKIIQVHIHRIGELKRPHE